MSIEQARLHIDRHHSGADGFITLARRNDDGRFDQEYYRVEEVSEKLSNWIGEDIFFSQNTFYRKRRRIEDVRELRAVYVDVDFYLLNYSPDWVIGHMEQELFGKRVPEPNLIIHSGRGFAVVWFIEPVPGKKALALWQAVESHFFRQFNELGGDPKATDAARVLRIAGSVNSKNGAEVKVDYRPHVPRYELRQLQADYLPELEVKKNRKKGRPSKVVRIHATRSLHAARLRDLSRLVELRNYAVKGNREILCFLYRYWSCCFLEDEAEALRQTLEFNSEFIDPLPGREVERATRSAEKAYRSRSDDKANEIAKSLGYPGAGYNVSNMKLIEWLDITPDEQRQLETIIGKAEKQRRNTEYQRGKRRAAGTTSRGQYIAEQAGRTESRLESLRKAMEANPGATQADLAEALGVSVRYIKKLVALMRK